MNELYKNELYKKTNSRNMNATIAYKSKHGNNKSYKSKDKPSEEALQVQIQIRSQAKRDNQGQLPIDV